MEKHSFIIRTTVLTMLMTLSCFPIVQAKVVTEEQAAIIAGQIMPIQGKKLTRKHLVKAGTPDGTYQPYYIFIGNDGKGFAIISADDVARPILGYSPDAELTPDGELPVPLVQWMTSISNQIRQAQENDIQQTAAVAKQWKEGSVGNIIVQLQTAKWGQEAPFYNKCPYDQGKRSLAGCVPVAYAILMKYYKYPQSGRGSTQRYVTATRRITVAARSLEHNYDWDNMPMQYTSGQYTSAQGNNVATLLADLGAALQVDYTNYNTTGFLGRGSLFTNFDYYPGTARLKDAYTASEWDDMMRMELDKERPIIYRADNVKGSGHAFLLDGYTNDGYFSINWGWGGYYNGLFTLDALTPGNDFYNSGHVAYLNTVPMPSSDTEHVVEMNGQDYPTLTTAIDEAPLDGAPTTINLLADVQAESYIIQKGQTITLNIGDHNIDMQFGFQNYGNLTVIGTEKSLITSLGNTGVFESFGTMDINGGTHKNISTIIGENNYRRCVWTAEGSETQISNVIFEAPGQVVCTNGKMTIESGTFTSTGNDEVISNYNTTDILTICGGTFLNNCAEISDTDYRRCVWTTKNSKTYIGNASFNNEYGSQTLCFNGEATINGADINNENGRYGCLVASNVNVIIEDCRLSAPILFYRYSGSQITCKGGLYSAKVDADFVAEGYECVPNRQAETYIKYPYMVQEIGTGIDSMSSCENQYKERFYNTQGILQPSLQKGVNLIRCSDGTTRKVLNN